MLFAVIASAFVASAFGQLPAEYRPTRECDDSGEGVDKVQGAGTNYWMWYAQTSEDGGPESYVWTTLMPGMCQPVDILGDSYQMMECVPNDDGEEDAMVTLYSDSNCEMSVGSYTYNRSMIPVSMQQGSHYPFDYWCNGTDSYSTVRIAIDSVCDVGANFHVATGPCLFASWANIMDNGCTAEAFYWQFYTPGLQDANGAADGFCNDEDLCTRYTVVPECTVMIASDDPINPAGLDVYAQMLCCNEGCPYEDDGDDSMDSEDSATTATLALITILATAFIHN